MGILQTRLPRIVLTMTILLICNYKPGVGGISGQVELLQKYLREEGQIANIFSTKGSFLWRLGLPYRLRKNLKYYDLLHIHCCSGWGFLPAVVGIIVGRHLGKRVVLTYHGGDGDRFFAKHTRIVKHFLSRTDANIVLSGFLGNTFKQHGLPYTIIPNIIELDNSRFRQRTTIRPTFICIRSHEELYNIPCILRAFKRVQVALPDATLTLVGDGSQHTVLISMAEKMQLHNVTFTGRVDNSEIYTHLDRADVMLSTPTVDNMPVSLLEAMNAGLLVISSNVGGVPYMIEDRQTGLLCESDNDRQLAEEMLWIIDHQEDSHNIIHQAHQAVNKYQWSNIKTKLYTLYGIPT